MEIETVKIDSLRPHPSNPRVHPDSAVERLTKSIKEYGWTNPILISEDNYILAGHARLKAAQGAELTEIPIIRLPLSGDKALAYMIADNKLQDMTEWDYPKLKDLLVDIDTGAIDMEITGFDEKELQDIFTTYGQPQDEVDEGPEPQIDRAEELQKEWGTELGQIWKIGKHRLMCGDATNKTNLSNLINIPRVNATLTDLPYAIGLDYGKYQDTLKALKSLINKFLPLAINISDVVLLTPGVTGQWLYPKPDWVLCWFYGGGQLKSSWGFNCWQPILAYGKEPHLKMRLGARPDAVDMNTPANEPNLNHPCPKPLLFWKWILERCTPQKDMTVYDPFLGSGTTILAAEQLSRICYGMEIEPKYVAVTLQRMSDMGLKPELIKQ